MTKLSNAGNFGFFAIAFLAVLSTLVGIVNSGQINSVSESYHLPLFITGHPRSGTTLMRLIFNAHSLISIPDETGIYHWFYKRAKVDRLLHPKMAENDVLKKAFGEDVVQLFDKQKKEIKKHSQSGVAFLFEEYLKKTGKKYWGDKTPLHTQFTSQILTDFSDATIINMVRDPRAVASSSLRYYSQKRGKKDFWISNDLETIISRWKKELELSLGLEKEYAEQFVTVRYEDLVNQAEQIVTELCLKIGIPFEQDMLNHSAKLEKSMPEQTEWHSEAWKPINKNNIDKFKDELTEEQLSYIEQEVGDLMNTLGYPFLTKL